MQKKKIERKVLCVTVLKDTNTIRMLGENKVVEMNCLPSICIRKKFHVNLSLIIYASLYLSNTDYWRPQELGVKYPNRRTWQAKYKIKQLQSFAVTKNLLLGIQNIVLVIITIVFVCDYAYYKHYLHTMGWILIHRPWSTILKWPHEKGLISLIIS